MTSDTPRTDSLPENRRYVDDGCEVAPSCLNCPLPICRYDDEGGARAIRNRDRDRRIRDSYQDGGTVDELAERFGISRRRIFFITEGMKKKPSRNSQPAPTPAPVDPMRLTKAIVKLVNSRAGLSDQMLEVVYHFVEKERTYRETGEQMTLETGTIGAHWTYIARKMRIESVTHLRRRLLISYGRILERES